MTEAQTKAAYIDPALREAGWSFEPVSSDQGRIKMEHPITEGRILGQGRRAKALFADYLLQYKNRNLAIIEAKAKGKYYTDGVAQAKDYAERLKIRFTYSTNGLRIYRIDMEEGTEGDVERFPTPDELWEMTFPTPVNAVVADSVSWRERLFAVPFETRSGSWNPRYYQDNAITKTLEAIADGEQRILLTLATGTGKTAIAFQIAWKLFDARWNLRRDGNLAPRILFLADRNILADQAFNSFNAFEENALVRIKPDEIKKKGKVPTNGNIFFTIFQTFMSGPDGSPYFGDYPQDFFDFIIIDECHRGGANDESSWRAIMEYFSPAVQLGLTATPKRDVNKDTYKYFGNPVYIYSLKEGINDGFLTPFRVKEISTTGDTYTYTDEDTILEGEIEEGREYTIEEQNKIIELMDIERYRVEQFMSRINQKQKTIVFCATQIHAAAVRDLINQFSDSTPPNYCHRVTANDGSLGEKQLRQFQDNEKTIPTILTTSQKLSTGVDAPEIRNIVLMRPVKSMVEFKQIVGRGTRLFEGKDYFTIYDFVKAHKHFNDDEWDGEPLAPEPCKRCGNSPCTCPPRVCKHCGERPCVCENGVGDYSHDGDEGASIVGEEPGEYRVVRVKLSDRNILELDSMVKTRFYSPSGTPISAEQFIKELFGDIPSFFSNEEELREIWSLPDTRKRLLQEMREKGYEESHLKELGKIIHGEDNDLFDVLNYIAYHKEMVPRLERARQASIHLDSYNPKQQEFLNFVLEQYVKEGVSELDDSKLPEILELKYHALADAKSELGDIKSIRETFIGFQKFLYDDGVA